MMLSQAIPLNSLTTAGQELGISILCMNCFMMFSTGNIKQ